MQRAVFAHPFVDGTRTDRHPFSSSVDRPDMRPGDGLISVKQSKNRVICSNHPRGALTDGVQDRLYVGRGLADDLQDMISRGLLVEGFGLFPSFLLQLVEEPRVLDGDYSLIRKGLKQLDLTCRKRSR